jgi:hypothetical protein
MAFPAATDLQLLVRLVIAAVLPRPGAEAPWHAPLNPGRPELWVQSYRLTELLQHLERRRAAFIHNLVVPYFVVHAHRRQAYDGATVRDERGVRSSVIRRLRRRQHRH